MGTKISVTTLTGGYASIDALNASFQALADEFDSVVYRDGTAPNSLTATLDANSQRLINLVDAVDLQEPVTLSQLNSAIAGVSAVDHGGLTGLADDDHAQYLLVSGAQNRSFFASSFATLTQAGDASSLHNHSSLYLTQSQVEAVATSVIHGHAFTAMNDVPTSYAGAGGFLVAVKAGVDGLEFIDPSTVVVTDHGGLTGLLDDDHTQYLLADGTRALSGNLAVDALVTIDGRDLSVDGTKLDGIESGATADQTAGEILTALLTVDGAGSGLDADLLDGISSAGFYQVGGTDVAVADGGTGRSSHTAYAVLCGGTGTTTPQQSVASVGAAGEVLTSNGVGALPTFQAAAAAGATPLPPQGRLTLSTGTPVMTSDVSNSTSIFYTPYVGDLVPVYNGTSWTMETFTELTNTTTDTTKNPAAVAANSNYDLFVWDDSGTLRLGRGPLWTSDTGRGTGAGTTEIARVNGIWMNANSITNGPAANRGTYVGTVRSDGGSTIDWIAKPVNADPPTTCSVNVWNTYNRVPVGTDSALSLGSWSYTATTPRFPNAETTWFVECVRGLNEDVAIAQYGCRLDPASTGFAAIMIGVDATMGHPNAFQFIVNGGVDLAGACQYKGLPGLGYHDFRPVEQADGTNSTTFGGGNALQHRFQVTLWA